MTKSISSRKKFLSVAVAASLASTAVMPAGVSAAFKFTDVSKDYQEAVQYLLDRDITKGVNGTSYGTGLPIKRADAAVMLSKAMNLPIDVGAKSGFTDVPERAEPHVAALKKAGIVQGKNNTQFASDSDIQRGEAAIMLTAAFDLKETTSEFPFSDVSQRYRTAVEALVSHEITQGKTATHFGTEDSLTRGEYAVFLHKIEKKVENDKKKEELRAAIADAEKLDKDDYTESDWKTIQDALEEAKKVEVSENPSQSEIDSALKQLEDVIENTPQADDDSADEAPESGGGGGGGGGNPDDIAYNTAKRAVDQAEETKTRGDIQKAYGLVQKLKDEDRKDDLLRRLDKVIGVNYDVLDTTIREAEKIEQDGYTDTSWKELQDEIANAKNVSKNDQATQKQVENAVKALNQAIQGLASGTPGDPQVSTYALEAAIETANALEEDLYTAPTWTALEEEVGSAENVLQDDKSTQNDVDTSTADLNQQIQQLELKDTESGTVDKSVLNAAIESARLFSEDHYTAATWTDFADALTEAKEVAADADATQPQVNQALKALHDAKESLELKTPENTDTNALKGALRAAIQTAESLNEPLYTSETWAALQTEVDRAKLIEQKEDATQREVNEALRNVLNAIEELQLSKTPIVDKTDLVNAINAAETTLAESEDASREAKNALRRAIRSAEKVAENNEATQEQVRKAAEKLNQAAADFKKDVSATSLEKAKAELRKVIQEANGLNLKDFESAGHQKLKNTLEAAESAVQASNATKTEIDRARTELEEAIQELVPTTVDKRTLNRVIIEAENALDNGTAAPSEEREQLQSAIDTAKSVYGSDEATAEQVTGAVSDLNDAISRFEKAVDNAERTEAKQNLEDKIAEADKIEQGNHTDESWKDLVDSLEKAKETENNPDSTTEELENALADLEEAIDNLEKQAVDKQELNDTIREAETALENGTAASAADRTALRRAINSAKRVADDEDATVQQVSQAVTDLKTAIAAFEEGLSSNELEQSKAELAKLIREAKRLDLDDYKEAGHEAFEAALASAEATASKESTKAEIDDARTALQTAMDQLEPVKTDKRELNHAIIEGETALEAGTSASPENQEKLQDALKAAEQVRDDRDATTEQVNQAVTDLNESIREFKEAVSEAERAEAKKDLEDKIAEADEIEKGNYTDESWQDFTEAVNNAKETVKNSDANTPEFEGALSDLKEAIDNLTQQAADKEELNQAIRNAEQALEAGTSASPEDRKNMQDAITAAKQVQDDREATAEQVSQAVTDLNDATREFESAVSEAERAEAKKDLEDKIAEADRIEQGNTPDENWQDLTDAIEQAKETVDNPDATKEDLDQALTDLEDALNNLNPESGVGTPQQKPAAEQTESVKTVQLLSKPVEIELEDKKKTAGGVLGLDAGILNLNLLDANQIGDINDSNKHTVIVEKGTTYKTDITVTIHTLLGGHNLKVHVFKKEEDGNYARVSTFRGSSGGLVGIANTARFTTDPLEEGTYKFILEIEEGLSIVQVVPFNLENQVVETYARPAQGALLNDWKLDNIDAEVTNVTSSGGSATEVNDGGTTTVQGQYGELEIDRTGNYSYTPSNEPGNIGKKETFNYTVTNTNGGKSATGSLKIKVGSDTTASLDTSLTASAVAGISGHSFPSEGERSATRASEWEAAGDSVLKMDARQTFGSRDTAHTLAAGELNPELFKLA